MTATTTDLAPIDTCRFVSELLWTDTRVWEVVKRTNATMTLRSTKHTDRSEPDMACDPGAYGTRVVRIEVESDKHGHTVTVRRRRGNHFAIGGGRSLRPVTGTPYARVDYRY